MPCLSAKAFSCESVHLKKSEQCSPNGIDVILTNQRSSH
jgi:hypothetical protein